MTNLSATQKENVFNFLNGLNIENLCITDYVNCEDIDFENAFESIQEKLEDNNGFDCEIIYYHNAIAYLMKNDPSLRDALEIANDFGYTPDKLNSEVLASLLASQNCRIEFQDLENEISEFFADLLEEIEEAEDQE